MEGSESLRVQSLQKAVRYYSQMTMQQISEIIELKQRFSNAEEQKEKLLEEKDHQLRAMQTKQQLMEAKLQQKEEEVSAFKQAGQTD